MQKNNIYINKIIIIFAKTKVNNNKKLLIN